MKDDLFSVSGAIIEHDLGDSCTARETDRGLHPPRIPASDKYARAAAVAAATRKHPRARNAANAYAGALIALAQRRLKGDVLGIPGEQTAADVEAVVAGHRRDRARIEAAKARFAELATERAGRAEGAA